MQSYSQHNNYKISIAQVTANPSNPRFTFDQRPIPALRNHISWDDEQEGRISRSKVEGSRSKGKPRRKKIFDPLPSNYESFGGFIRSEKSQEGREDG
jgi:hypothetical protein